MKLRVTASVEPAHGSRLETEETTIVELDKGDSKGLELELARVGFFGRPRTMARVHIVIERVE